MREIPTMCEPGRRLTAEVILAAYRAGGCWPGNSLSPLLTGCRYECWSALYIQAVNGHGHLSTHEAKKRLAQAANKWAIEHWGIDYWSGVMDGWDSPTRPITDGMNEETKRGIEDGAAAAIAIAPLYDGNWWRTKRATLVQTERTAA